MLLEDNDIGHKHHMRTAILNDAHKYVIEADKVGPCGDIRFIEKDGEFNAAW